jgi:hypothetical protein
MARRGNDTVGVEIKGLERLAREPVMDAGKERLFLDRGVKQLAKNVAAVAPGGPDGSVGRSIYGYAFSDTRGVVGSQHPGARALDRGAFITGHNGRVLRFEIGGETVFARYARIRARHYFNKGLKDAGQVLQAEFSRTFGDR